MPIQHKPPLDEWQRIVTYLGWPGGEGQGAAGATIRERGGVVPQGCCAIRADAVHFG